MKFFAAFLFIVFPFIANAQTNDEAAIRALMSKQQSDWNAGSIDNFMQGYWETARDNYKKHYPDAGTMGKLRLDILQMRRLSAEYYFVIGKWNLSRKADDVGGDFTLLFKKINGIWLIVVDHTD